MISDKFVIKIKEIWEKGTRKELLIKHLKWRKITLSRRQAKKST